MITIAERIIGSIGRSIQRKIDFENAAESMRNPCRRYPCSRLACLLFKRRSISLTKSHSRQRKLTRDNKIQSRREKSGTRGTLRDIFIDRASMDTAGRISPSTDISRSEVSHPRLRARFQEIARNKNCSSCSSRAEPSRCFLSPATSRFSNANQLSNISPITIPGVRPRTWTRKKKKV